MMESFSADWLALREPADVAARSSSLPRAVASGQAHPLPMRVLDLGAGTGANLRFMAGPLPQPQHWLLVDHDARLLDQVPSRMPPDRRALCQVTMMRADLADIESIESAIFEKRSLVTASALLDLVSE